jgi:hypothetical protein
LQLLAANGIDGASATLLDMGTSQTIKALEHGDIEAGFVVLSEPTKEMIDLLTRRQLQVLPFDRAEAYRIKFPYLTTVRLPMGSISLPANVPPTDVTLVAPTGMLVARDDIHPALVNLLLQSATQIESHRQLFAAAETFPIYDHLDFPLHPDAERYAKRGPSFFYRYLPFWIAVWIERLTVLTIPLLTMIPIMRMAPPAYRWQVQRKVYRWYAQLRRIEDEAERRPDAAERDKLRQELADIQLSLLKLRVPLSYAQQLYDLRQHVDFVRTRLG